MPEPADLRAYRRHAEWALVSITALEQGVVDALADGPANVGELASELSMDRRALRVLLGVLEETGLVREEPGGWRLTGEARGLFVDADTPDYHRDAALHWLEQLREWAADLPEALRRGGPPPDESEEAGSDRASMEAFQAAMANKNPTLVRDVVDACLERTSGVGRLLDVGGGPGTFSREFLRRGWRAVLVDRPDVVEHVSSAYGLGRLDGLELVGGDFHAALPDGPFEAILLANITHLLDEATNAELLGRCADRLPPGGVLAVMDFVRGRTPFAALFAVTMLLNTEAGGTYGLPAYRRWLEDAGLEDVRCVTVSEERQVVTAVRPR